MLYSLDIELTAADIMILTDLIYDSVPGICLLDISASEPPGKEPMALYARESLGRLFAFAVPNGPYVSPCSTA